MPTRTRTALFLAPVATAALLAAASVGLANEPEPDPPLQVTTAARQEGKGLTPGTARAFERARRAAATAGLPLELTSGYRSPEQQRAEFADAVRKYGSEAAASRYVLPPEKSAHVKGAALDIRPEQTARWLESEGSRLGLCRIYSNEWWHFEYAARHITHGCPALKPDAQSG